MSNDSSNATAPRLSHQDWWKAFNDLLEVQGLPHACFAIAREYYGLRLTPAEAVAREIEVEARLAA
jgi:hypothetical protein